MTQDSKNGKVAAENAGLMVFHDVRISIPFNEVC
jgi:hypothetical protein